MKKHVIKNLKLREISSVDRPAQVGAVSVLIKRHEDPETVLAKATFSEALKGNFLSEKVNDAFYNAFDSWWTGKEAFRKALVDELAAGGDGTTASDDFKAWMGSLVDQALGAAKAIGAGDVASLEKAFNQAAELWLANQETDMTIKTKAELKTAIDKALASGDAVTVGEVTAIHKAAGELKAEDMLPASGVLAKAASAGIDPALVARLDRMEKRDALSTDLRKHYDGLTSDTDRDAFLAKSADDQTAELAKGAGSDPVVYTTLDGIDIRKNDGNTVLALAKRNDQLARDLAKSAATSEDVVLTKRAGDELGSVGGDLVGKKALLKAVDAITDTTTRDLAKAVLASANTLAKGAFKKQGSNTPGAATVVTEDGYEMSGPEAELEEMAKARAKADNVTFEKAYSDVIQTQEGAALYKRFVEGGE